MLLWCSPKGATIDGGWATIAGGGSAELVAVLTAVNVLLVPGGLSVPELASLGVRRVSTGSGLSTLAYGAFVQGARHVLDHGVPDPGLPGLAWADQQAAFS